MQSNFRLPPRAHALNVSLRARERAAPVVLCLMLALLGGFSLVGAPSCSATSGAAAALPQLPTELRNQADAVTLEVLERVLVSYMEHDAGLALEDRVPNSDGRPRSDAELLDLCDLFLEWRADLASATGVVGEPSESLQQLRLALIHRIELPSLNPQPGSGHTPGGS